MKIPAPKNAKPRQPRKSRAEREPVTTITIGEHTASLDEVEAVIGGMTGAIKAATAPPPKKCTRYLRHDFSKEERLDLAAKLAQAVERVGSLNAELDDIKAAFKGKIGASETETATLSQSINKGYEMRSVQCLVALHAPENGKKTTTRLDTGEVVEIESMDAVEMQEQLPLEGAAA